MCDPRAKLTLAQLNDIISLVVGLWAVKAAAKSSTDKYTFGVSRKQSLDWEYMLIDNSGYGLKSLGHSSMRYS